jgi:hypothetical protein
MWGNVLDGGDNSDNDGICCSSALISFDMTWALDDRESVDFDWERRRERRGKEGEDLSVVSKERRWWCNRMIVSGSSCWNSKSREW